jgi:Fe2+ or Zn2+ uptake regulation protein
MSLTVFTEDRRLSILLVLNESPSYSANAFLVQTAVASIYGHNVSLDTLRTDLAWLAEQGLVHSKTTGDVTVATLTARGVDVAAGRAVQPGVKRPLP